jgi:glycosyltransferase involved in cell wall biosynthesis
VNLLLVNYEYPPVGGGAANATQSLGRIFHELGHRVYVLTSGLRGAAGISNEDGIRVHRLPVGRRQADRATQGEMLAFLIQSRREVSRVHREQAFDAAIAFFTIPSGPAALRLHHLAGVPYLVSLRGGDVPGHVPGLGLKHILTRPLRRRVLRHAGAIVANSAGLAETSRAADPFPVHVIPNGVDSYRFHPAPESETHRAHQPLRLLFVGRVHPEKNLGIVLRQLAALPPATQERYELQIAGDGAQRPALEELAGKLGLSVRVRWLGWQPKEAVPALYRSTDALINPSQYEGMPNVVLEAMASGLPVLASDVPGNRAAVAPGRTGILFPLDQPDQLGTALTRLAADAAWGRAMGQAGRRRVEAEFSWLRTAQSYLELLLPLTPTSGSS